MSLLWPCCSLYWLATQRTHNLSPAALPPGAELEQAKGKSKTAQDKALQLGEGATADANVPATAAGHAQRLSVMQPGSRCAGLTCLLPWLNNSSCCTCRPFACSTTACPCPTYRGLAAKKARASADEAKQELADCQAKLEAATGEASKAAAQVAALQAEKQRLQQRIATLEAELAASREAAAAAAAAARRGPAAREAGQRQVAEIQERAMAQLQQELKKAVQKRKLPEAAAPADAATPPAAAATDAATPAAAAAEPESVAAEQPASKRTRVTPPAAEEAAEEPAAAEEEEQAADEAAAMEEDEEAEQVRGGAVVAQGSMQISRRRCAWVMCHYLCHAPLFAFLAAHKARPVPRSCNPAGSGRARGGRGGPI